MTSRGRVGTFLCLLIAVAPSLGCRGADREAEEAEFKVTSMVFAGSLDQVVLAITNAFGNGAYHGKWFFETPYDYVMMGQKRIAVPLTNTWLLGVPPGPRLPLTLVPLGRTMAAYDADFQIKAESAGPARTKVSVQPTSSGTTERKYERSPHLALVLGGRYLPPLPSEATNLFCRIERQLREIQAGRANALPHTQDTAPGFYSHFWRDMSVKEKHDPGNWDKMVQAWKALQAVEATTNNAIPTSKSIR